MGVGICRIFTIFMIFSGPTVLAIKEPDKSVTVTSGTIKVGKYTFMLTVKDKEELKSSATLTVTVKKGTSTFLTDFIIERRI